MVKAHLLISACFRRNINVASFFVVSVHVNDQGTDVEPSAFTILGTNIKLQYFKLHQTVSEFNTANIIIKTFLSLLQDTAAPKLIFSLLKMYAPLSFYTNARIKILN